MQGVSTGGQNSSFGKLKLKVHRSILVDIEAPAQGTISSRLVTMRSCFTKRCPSTGVKVGRKRYITRHMLAEYKQRLK